MITDASNAIVSVASFLSVAAVLLLIFSRTARRVVWNAVVARVRRQTVSVPGPLTMDDPFLAMVGLEGHRVWNAVHAIDWQKRKDGLPRDACEVALVPTDEGFLLIQPSGIRSVPFDQYRNLRVRKLGSQGFVRFEARRDDGSWIPITLSTKREVAVAVVKLVDQLRSEAGK